MPASLMSTEPGRNWPRWIAKNESLAFFPLPTLLCFPPRSIPGRSHHPRPAFTRFLALRRVGNRVVVVPLVRLLAAGLDRLLRRVRWDQAVAAADQVRAARLHECLTHLEVVLRLEELHQRPLHL